jgi:hypothetical protein
VVVLVVVAMVTTVVMLVVGEGSSVQLMAGLRSMHNTGMHTS